MPPVPRVTGDPRNFPTSLPGRFAQGAGALNHGAALTRVASANQRYTLGLGAATAGNFTLTVNQGGNDLGTTANIAFNANAATVQTRLEAVVGAGNVSVTGGPLPGTVTIEFVGNLAGDAITVTGAFGGLTGATPALSATQAAAVVTGGRAADGNLGGRVGRGYR